MQQRSKGLLSLREFGEKKTLLEREKEKRTEIMSIEDNVK